MSRAETGAPIAWFREALQRRDDLAADGVHLSVVATAWGVSVFARNGAHIGRAWDVIEAATINPLIPTIETVARSVLHPAK